MGEGNNKPGRGTACIHAETQVSHTASTKEDLTSPQGNSQQKGGRAIYHAMQAALPKKGLIFYYKRTTVKHMHTKAALPKKGLLASRCQVALDMTHPLRSMADVLAT